MSEQSYGVWVYCAHCGRHIKRGRLAGQRVRARDLRTRNAKRAKGLELRVKFEGEGEAATSTSHVICPVDGELGPYAEVTAAEEAIRVNPRQVIKVRLYRGSTG